MSVRLLILCFFQPTHFPRATAVGEDRRWRVEVPGLGVAVDMEAVNGQSWMGGEGPIG
jgi:hypothetical protein